MPRHARFSIGFRMSEDEDAAIQELKDAVGLPKSVVMRHCIKDSIQFFRKKFKVQLEDYRARTGNKPVKL